MQNLRDFVAERSPVFDRKDRSCCKTCAGLFASRTGLAGGASAVL
uniref:Uncharacterized protein n=1 Tax=Escherichia coli TaxID=562 RepID=A0A2S1PLN5_ECOLX|nr:hypothetical protein [Escherichia coli]QQZ45604.1 hypothetical protein [Escherichia coli]QQZ45645.1 hypothetical protein [Escherichia coli]